MFYIKDGTTYFMTEAGLRSVSIEVTDRSVGYTLVGNVIKVPDAEGPYSIEEVIAKLHIVPKSEDNSAKAEVPKPARPKRKTANKSVETPKPKPRTRVKK